VFHSKHLFYFVEEACTETQKCHSRSQVR